MIMRGHATRCAEEPSLLDVMTIRAELAAYYDLTPSVELPGKCRVFMPGWTG